MQTRDWTQERRPVSNPAAVGRKKALEKMARSASAWGLFVRERKGQEGPKSAQGIHYRYVGGRAGEIPEVGFDTLPAVAAWLGKNTDLL